MITSIPCVILAGGKSSRMGEDKSLLPFDGFNTLIEYQYSKLSKIFSKVYISSKNNKFNFSCHIIYDDNKDISSPMIALKSILDSIQEDKVFIVTVDTPFIQEKVIKKLIENSNNYEITIAKDKNKVHNLCGVFKRGLINIINKYIKEDIHKINYLIKSSNSSYISFSDDTQFININTKEDYKEAKTIISTANNSY